MQSLINVLYIESVNIDMPCNVQKYVAICNARNLNKSVNTIFQNFTLRSSVLQFASEFKYLGHIISNDL